MVKEDTVSRNMKKESFVKYEAFKVQIALQIILFLIAGDFIFLHANPIVEHV